VKTLSVSSSTPPAILSNQAAIAKTRVANSYAASKP
jgi:hypothetical protein